MTEGAMAMRHWIRFGREALPTDDTVGRWIAGLKAEAATRRVHLSAVAPAEAASAVVNQTGDIMTTTTSIIASVAAVAVLGSGAAVTSDYLEADADTGALVAADAGTRAGNEIVLDDGRVAVSGNSDTDARAEAGARADVDAALDFEAFEDDTFDRIDQLRAAVADLVERATSIGETVRAAVEADVEAAADASAEVWSESDARAGAAVETSTQTAGDFAAEAKSTVDQLHDTAEIVTHLDETVEGDAAVDGETSADLNIGGTTVESVASTEVDTSTEAHVGDDPGASGSVDSSSTIELGF